MTESLTYSIEKMSDVIVELNELWLEHWNETEEYRAKEKYNPDYYQFAQLEKIGQFLLYTARNESGALVGDLGYVLHHGRHTGQLSATEDFFYLRPNYRVGFNAVKFIRFAVEDLKKRGVVHVGMSSKLTNDIDVLLRRAGFTEIGRMYSMTIEENLDVLR